MKHLLPLLILLAHTCSAETLFGLFYYTKRSPSHSTIFRPPQLVNDPAFFLFDTESQKLKVFNFLESYIDPDLYSHDFKEYSVSRLSGTGDIETINELTDFSIVEWRHYAVPSTEEPLIGHPDYLEIRTDSQGRFTYVEPDYFSVKSGSGEIISFELNTREDKEEGWRLDDGVGGILFKLKTRVGYKYDILEGSHITSLTRKSFSKYSNTSSDGMLIGGGEHLFSIDTSKHNTFFMKSISHPIEMSD